MMDAPAAAAKSRARPVARWRAAPRARWDRRVRPLAARRAFQRLIRNPDDTEQVFVAIRALSGSRFERLLRRVRRDPQGARNLCRGGNEAIGDFRRDASSRGRDAAFLPAVDWESLLERPLDGVRQERRVGAPRSYEPHRTAAA